MNKWILWGFAAISLVTSMTLPSPQDAEYHLAFAIFFVGACVVTAVEESKRG